MGKSLVTHLEHVVKALGRVTLRWSWRDKRWWLRGLGG